MTATYRDPSAIVKLAVREPESDALRRHLRRRRPPGRAPSLGPGSFGPSSVEGPRVGFRSPCVRPHRSGLIDRVLSQAGTLEAGDDLGEIVPYDERLAGAAQSMGSKVSAPG